MRTTTFQKQVSAGEINYMHDQGMSNKDIAKRLGTTCAAINQYFPEEKRRYTKVTKSDVDEMVRYFKEEYSVQWIAIKFNCATSTVYRNLISRGIIFESKRGGRPKKKKDVGLPEAPKETAPANAGRLDQEKVGIYRGRIGKYVVDREDKTASIPEMMGWLNKEQLGYLIRDLMIVWQEL